jgi:hypothetical protein
MVVVDLASEQTKYTRARRRSQIKMQNAKVPAGLARAPGKRLRRKKSDSCARACPACQPLPFGCCYSPLDLLSSTHPLTSHRHTHTDFTSNCDHVGKSSIAFQQK